MRTRHLGRALVGLVAAAATIGLLGLPGSAHTTASGTGNITSGTLTVINADGTTLTTQTLGTTGTGVTCTASSASLTMTDPDHPHDNVGTWTWVQTSSTGVQIGTQWFKSDLIIALVPNTNTTWSSNYTGSALTATGGFAVATLTKSSATTPCTPLTTAGPCTIRVSNISVTGTHTVAAPPTILPGHSATVSGGTNTEGDLGFEVAVTGTAGNCGSLIAANDGAVTFSTVTFLVTSVP
jgi:hypothetical protein